jgi:hypothetical protein
MTFWTKKKWSYKIDDLNYQMFYSKLSKLRRKLEECGHRTLPAKVNRGITSEQ